MCLLGIGLNGPIRSDDVQGTVVGYLVTVENIYLISKMDVFMGLS